MVYEDRQRTRSPFRRTDKTLKISRAVCGFGRYADNRPPGLNLLPGGGLRLSELMAVWGRKQGLREDDVLQAIKAHMFHDGTSGALRFSIDCNEEGEIILRVLPRRAKEAGSRETRTNEAFAMLREPQPQRQLRKRSPIRVQAVQGRGSILNDLPSGVFGPVIGVSPFQNTPRRGSILSEVPPDAAPENNPLRAIVSSSPPRVECSTQGKSSSMRLQEKLDMPLDALVGAPRAPATEVAVPYAPMGHDEVNRQFAQMDPTKDTNQMRLPSGSCASALGINGDVAMSDVGGPALRARPQRPVAPSRPPGDYWTQYKDEDQNGNHVYWWHYEGPLGKWWSMDDSKEPQPYVPEQ